MRCNSINIQYILIHKLIVSVTELQIPMKVFRKQLRYASLRFSGKHPMTQIWTIINKVNIAQTSRGLSQFSYTNSLRPGLQHDKSINKTKPSSFNNPKRVHFVMLLPARTITKSRCPYRVSPNLHNSPAPRPRLDCVRTVGLSNFPHCPLGVAHYLQTQSRLLYRQVVFCSS